MIAPSGSGLALELELPPDVEVVAVLRDPADCDAYGDFATVPGLRQYLLAGADDRGRLRTLAGVLYRTPRPRVPGTAGPVPSTSRCSRSAPTRTRS